MTTNNKIALFEKKEIRKVWHQNEWWFVINDVIYALTDSVDAKDYFKKIKKRDNELKILLTEGGDKLSPP